MRKFRLLSICLAVFCAVSFFSFNFDRLCEVKAETVHELHYWDFEDSLNDAAGKYELGGEAVYAEGKDGKALYTAEMDAAPRTQKLTCNTLDGYTMGAWIKLNDTAVGFNIVMAKGNTGSPDPDRFQIHISDAGPDIGGGNITVYSPATSSGAYPGEGDSRFIPFDTWTHVATTWNGNFAKVFVNGVKIFEIEITGQLEDSVDSFQKITVGALSDGTTFKFDGLIDGAFYANYAMTEADIAAAAGAGGNAALKAWADGSTAFTPDEMKGHTDVAPVTDGEPVDTKTEGHVFMWSFENDYKDLSHREFDLDYEEMYPDFTEGKLGQAVLLEDVSICTDSFPEDMDLSEFTLSYWFRFDGVPNALPYYVMAALGDKAEPYHFETYLVSQDCESATDCFYNVIQGSAVENLGTVRVGEFAHFLVTNSKANGIRVYLNGELVYRKGTPADTSALVDGLNRLSIGALQDYSLPAYGAYDEVILADYAFPDDLVAKLYADPQGAHDDVAAIVKANAPEGYARATAKPTAEPTEVPTSAPATEVPEEPTNAPATKAPEKAADDGAKSDSTAMIIIIIAAVLVVAIIIAIIFILKKKKNK